MKSFAIAYSTSSSECRKAMARAPSRPSVMAASTSSWPICSAASVSGTSSSWGREAPNMSRLSGPPNPSRWVSTSDAIRPRSTGSRSRAANRARVQGLPGPWCMPYQETAPNRALPSSGVERASAPDTESSRRSGLSRQNAVSDGSGGTPARLARRASSESTGSASIASRTRLSVSSTALGESLHVSGGMSGTGPPSTNGYWSAYTLTPRFLALSMRSVACLSFPQFLR